MNIWIVNHYAIPPSMGGLVRHYYFSKYLQKQEHTVRIFSSSKVHNTSINLIKGKALYETQIVDDIGYTFVQARDYKANGLDRMLNLVDFPFKVWKAMSQFFKSEKPDVIYTSSPDLFVAFFAMLFGRKHKIPVVMEVRDFWPESIVAYQKMSKYNPIIKILYKLEKWMYKQADELIFLVEGWEEYFKNKGWDKIIDTSKCTHISNGVDITEFQNNEKNYQIQDADLEDTNSFKLIYMGSIRYVNNLQTLIDAAKVMKARGFENIKILIYGDGTQREELERECQKHELDVVFKGQIEKKYIPYILSKADVNLVNVKQSNLKEYGCSWNKLFEYMASGKPILSTAPVAYDLITRYHLGIAKEFKTAEEFADSIVAISQMTEQEKEDICKNGKNEVKEFDYQRLTDKLLTVLEKAYKK